MLNRIETMLGISGSAQVYEIYRMTLERLQQKIGCIDPLPTELEWIVVEVAVARYNRIGSEGVRAHSVEGESMSWDGADDFAPYEKDIQDWLIEHGETSKGVIRFL